ncbi:MAG: TonB-dependent receptor [Parahaliea sp.]
MRGELDDAEAVPRLPPRRAGIRLAWQGEALSLWSRVVNAAAQHRPSPAEAPTAGYTRWDVGVDYDATLDRGQLTLFAALCNLGDQDIRLSTSFRRQVAPEAGRSLEAGLRYRF